MEAVAALVPSLGALSPADLLDRAADARRRFAPQGPAAPVPEAPREEPPDDETVLIGELLSAGRMDQGGADADRDSRLPGTPALRNALANGAEPAAARAIQSYEDQRQAGYVQELRQATLVDLYV